MSCYETPKTYGTDYKPIHPCFEFFQNSEINRFEFFSPTGKPNPKSCPSDNYSTPVTYGTDYGRIYEFKNGKCVKRKGDNTIGIF